MENHQICAACMFQTAGTCRKDDVNIFVHALSTGCPIGKFPATQGDKPRGLGDTIANVIQTATFGLVKPCGGCKERQARLNEKFPYTE